MLTDNLTSYWKLNDNSNDNAGAKNGTDTSVTYSAGKINSGAGFNGSSSFIALPAGSAPVGGNARSISLWFKSSSTSAGTLFGYGNTGSGGNCLLHVNITAGKLYWGFGSGDFESTNVVFTNDSTWHHAVVTYAGGTRNTTNVKMYVNGVNVTTNNPNVAAANTVDASFGIGKDIPYNTRFFNGAVDEVGVWSRALSSTEVTELYNAGAGIQYPFTTSGVLFDAKSTGAASATSLTIPHTCTGSDRYLGVSVGTHVNQGTVSGVTYAGAAMTLIGGHDGNNNSRIQLWGIVAPATGTNNIVISRPATTAAIRGKGYSFTGVNQSNPINVSAVFPRTDWTSVTTFNPSLTASMTGCVGLLAFFADSGPALTPGSNSTVEVQEATAFGQSIARNSLAVSGTTVQISMTSASQGFAGVMAALEPVPLTTGNTRRRMLMSTI